MIKVFTTDKGPAYAGDHLTLEFEKWYKTLDSQKIEILNIHSNSNKFGWMMIIHYKLIES